MISILQQLKSYSFILLWIIGGFINSYLGAAIAIATFLLMIGKKMYIRTLISFWLLLMFSDSTIGGLHFAHVAKPMVMFILGFSSLFLASKNGIKNTFIFPFTLLFIYLFLVSFFQPNFIVSIEKILSYLFIYLSPPIIFLLIKREGKTEELLKSIVFWGNAILLISVLLAIFIPNIGAQFGNRLNGVFRNPNGIGIFIVLYGVLSYIIFHKIPSSKATKRLTTFLIIIIMIMSGSRSAFGALLIFLIGTNLAKKSPWFFVVITIIFFFIYQSTFDLAILAINKMGYGKLFRLDTLDMASGRIYVWQAAKAEINDFFFWGGGFTYSESGHWISKHMIDIPDLIQHQGNVHQSFLSFWLNNGLIGLALFAFGWIRTIFFSLKKSYLTLPIVAALVFSASYESWMIASLNPYTIQMILIFTIILFFNDSEVLEEKKFKKLSI